ncbi:hypothetical protein CDV36_003651 [Fusarium kuroshium]|uniref:Protein kinase domain-containing protein n=1 Tax=Fusarium kuroshium TaxID=2010991 RepID=A0A3M2SGG2_9HYPO|nr:hypothetical protein CDV36_003651 [Fusarium kuroshium]
MEDRTSYLQAKLKDIKTTAINDTSFYVFADVRRIVTKDAITELTAPYIPDHQHRKLVEDVLEDGVRLFCILFLMDRLDLLQPFLTHDVRDSRLPYQEAELKRMLPTLDVSSFLDLRRQFFPWSFKGNRRHLVLPDDTVLPFISEEFMDTGAGGTVSLVTIPSELQDFDQQQDDPTVKVVRKCIKPVANASATKAIFDRERECLELYERLRHPSIIPLLGSYTIGESHNLLFPRYQMNLEEFLKREKTDDFHQHVTMSAAIADLASAVQAVHEVTIRSEVRPLYLTKYGFHHDIRPANILVSDGRFILADFGLAYPKPYDTDRPPNITWNSNVGHYIAPECMDRYFEHQIVGRSYDIWAFGCLLSELATYIELGPGGVERFRKSREADTYYDIPWGNGYFFEADPSGRGARLKSEVAVWFQSLVNASKDSITPLLIAVSKQMLSPEPKQRPTMEQSLSHLSAHEDTEAQLYQHPSYVYDNTRFEKNHDRYSLGIVLLEVAYWKPVQEVRKNEKSMNITQFRERLLSNLPPPSQSISLIIERDIQLVDNSTPLPILSLVTRLVRMLRTRGLREYLFGEESGIPIGEGATYQVAMIESVQFVRDGHRAVARKTAKFMIPKRLQATGMYQQELHTLRVVSFEIELLSHPAIQKHPHIASLAGFSWNESAGGYAPCLIMEMATYGNARSFTSSRVLSETERSTLCGHVASGLDFLHASSIVHGDVKQENVLVFSDDQSTTGFTAKITDFERSPQSGENFRYTGTVRYNAPEIQNGCLEVEPGQLWRCDVFAFGLLVLEVFSGSRTYDDIDARFPLRSSIEKGAACDSEQALPLALKLAENFRIISLAGMQTCQAILRLTLPHSPAHRLPHGWREVHELLETNIVPFESSAVLLTTMDPSSYLMTDLCGGIADNRDNVAGALWSDLQHAAETLLSDQDKGKAAFSLFICYAVGSYSTCKSIEEALEFVTSAAEAGYPPALLCGKRIFQANQIPVHHIFEKEPDDPNLRKMLYAVQRVPSAKFFSRMIQLLLPQTLRAQQAEALGLLPDHQVGQADFVNWITLKHEEIGKAAFQKFAEDALLFHHAVVRSDFAACKSLVALSCNVNRENSAGITPLHLTVLCAEVGMFKFLLAHGAVVKLSWDSRIALLHWLVVLPEEEVPRIVQGFLSMLDDDAKRSKVCNSKLDFNLDDLGLTLKGSPLEWAISCRNLTMVKALTAPGLHIPANSMKLISLAVGLGGVEILRHLLETDSVLQGLSPLDRYEIFAHLGNRGSDLTRWIMHGSSHQVSVSQVIDTLENFGIHLPAKRGSEIDGKETSLGPVRRAAVGNHVGVLKELLRRGLDVHENDPTTKPTVLEDALRHGRLHGPEHRFMESLQLLLSHGANTGAQPMLHAACSEDIPIRIFKFLLQEDIASINVKYQGTTPLLELLRPPVQSDLYAKVQALIEAGSNINVEVADGKLDQEEWKCCWTPLACSLYYLNWDIAEYLLDKGASLEYGSSSGYLSTVLHLLIFKALRFCPGFQQKEYFKLVDIIESLLSYQEARETGLINKVNYQGIDALRLSVMFGLVHIVMILMDERHGLGRDSIQGVVSLMPSLLMPVMAPKFVAFDEAERDMIKSRNLPCYMISEYAEHLQEIYKFLSEHVDMGRAIGKTRVGPW